MNCALKIFFFLVLITLVASFPASISSQQNNGEHDQLTSLARVQQSSAQTASDTLPGAKMEGPVRSKRAIIFRPLFVYRQQEIKKQRLKEERQQKAQTAAVAQPVPAGSNYAPNYYYKKNCNC